MKAWNLIRNTECKVKRTTNILKHQKKKTAKQTQNILRENKINWTKMIKHIC